jgi:hypothetical protein
MLILTALTQPAASRANAAPYEAMVPLRQYLATDRQAEIDLARSAAPASISLHATILVLTAKGYETAETGTNGFTCLVERSWMKSFDDAQFWNPKVRTPVCYNAPAVSTVLRYTLFRTQLALAGATKEKIQERVQNGIAHAQLPSTAPGSIAYMMSKLQYIDDVVKAWHSHVMIYADKAEGSNNGESWGADERGSPVIYDDGHKINPEPWSLFFILVPHWSDGSLSP